MQIKRFRELWPKPLINKHWSPKKENPASFLIFGESPPKEDPPEAARAKFVMSADRWVLRIFGDPRVVGMEFKGVDFEITSPFGEFHSAVVTKENGEPLFDRPCLHEPPFPQCVVWGRETDGRVMICVIKQERPHAYNVFGTKEPSIFAQMPMGYAHPEKTLIESAQKEVMEETGAIWIKNITRPSIPLFNPHPGFIASWGSIFFVEVDPTEPLGLPDQSEGIRGVEWIDAKTLRYRIAEGIDQDDAVYRWSSQLGIWFLFFCCHPRFGKELFE